MGRNRGPQKAPSPHLLRCPWHLLAPSSLEGTPPRLPPTRKRNPHHPNSYTFLGQRDPQYLFILRIRLPSNTPAKNFVLEGKEGV